MLVRRPDDWQQVSTRQATLTSAVHVLRAGGRVQIAEVQAKNDAKRQEIEELQTKEKALMAEFLAGIGENKFADYLTKVYRKRIKRSKKKKEDDEGSESEEEEDESDDEEMLDEEELEEGEEGESYDLDVCPPGCSPVRLAPRF